MKRIRIALWIVLVLPAALWLAASGGTWGGFGLQPVRSNMLQLTGIIAITAMSAAMVLATRPRWLEPHLDGLDKMYRLHKWLGIAALAASVLHWFFKRLPHWLSDLGLWQRPPRSGAEEDNEAGLELLFDTQRHFAETVGEWAFYAAVALIAAGLVRRVPYGFFARTHKVIAAAYLLLAYHSVILLRFQDWGTPAGVLTGLFLAAGSVAAAIVLLGRVGARSKVRGTIETLEYFEQMHVLAAWLQLEDGWRGHQAGQFAFVTYDEAEGPHPFTISSAWDPADQRILFISKSLGDYTRLLPERLSVGGGALVEGPYGCFTYDDRNSRQIWIGAGIGITPFIARMRQLEKTQQPHDVDLFHPTSDIEPEALQRLAAAARAAGVRLHVVDNREGGRLDADYVKSAVQDWQEASIWFCGPAGFGQALRAQLVADGLPAGRFHQELFNMR